MNRHSIRNVATLTLAIGGALALGYRRIFVGQVLAGRDLYRVAFPDATVVLEALSHGELPLWNPYLRMGQPLAATLYAQAFYPPRLLCIALLGPIRGITAEHLLHVLLAAAGTYLLCRRLRCSHVASISGALAFSFSGLFFALNTQFNVIAAAAWSGFILAFSLRLARRPTIRSASALAVTLGFSFLAGSPETTLWQLLYAAVLCLGSMPKPRQAIAYGASVVWAVALSAVELLPGAELAANSLRRQDTNPAAVLDWSLSWPQLLGAVFPGADLPLSRVPEVDQRFMMSVALGAIPCALALASIGSRRRGVRAIQVGALVLILIALGSHFAPAGWLIVHSPLNRFRFPAKYFLGAAFGIAALSAVGMDRLGARARHTGRAVVPWIVTVVVWGALFLIAPVLARWLGARPHASGAILGSSIFIVLGLSSFFLLSRSPRRAYRWRLFTAGLLAAELLVGQVLFPSLTWEDPARIERASALRAQLPASFDRRISADFWFESGTDQYPPNAGPDDFVALSRDALELNRFAEERLSAVEGYGAPEPLRADAFLRLGQRGAYDLAGVEFYSRWSQPPFPDLEPLVALPRLPRLYRSRTAMDRAFLVHQARIVTNTEALSAIASTRQPFRDTALLASGTALATREFEDPRCEETVTWTKRTFSVLELSVRACSEGYLIMSDTVYPGWKAQVDGADSAISRADYTLRAVHVTAGKHEVKILYSPKSFWIGVWLSLLACMAVVAAHWNRARKSSATSRPGVLRFFA